MWKDWRTLNDSFTWTTSPSRKTRRYIARTSKYNLFSLFGLNLPWKTLKNPQQSTEHRAPTCWVAWTVCLWLNWTWYELGFWVSVESTSQATYFFSRSMHTHGQKATFCTEFNDREMLFLHQFFFFFWMVFVVNFLQSVLPSHRKDG